MYSWLGEPGHVPAGAYGTVKSCLIIYYPIRVFGGLLKPLSEF